MSAGGDKVVAILLPEAARKVLRVALETHIFFGLASEADQWREQVIIPGDDLGDGTTKPEPEGATDEDRLRWEVIRLARGVLPLLVPAPIAVQANVIACDLLKGPCSDVRDGVPCLEREQTRGLKGRRRGFENFDTSKICSACLPYWHAQRLATLMEERARWEKIQAAEAGRR